MTRAVRSQSGMAAARPPARSGLLDTPPDDGFDELTGLAARLLDVPVVLLSLVERERSTWLSVSGVDARAGRGQPYGDALCRHVVARGAPVVVRDAVEDRVADAADWMRNVGVRAWLGVPVADRDGRVVGALCGLDAQPRDWTAADVASLQAVAVAVAARLGELAARSELAQARTAAEQAGRRLDRLAAVALALGVVDTVTGLVEVVVDRALPVLGVDGGAVLLGEGGRWRLAVSHRLDEQVQLVYGDLPWDSPLPAPWSARENRRLVLANRAAGLAFSDTMFAVYADTGRLSWVFVPLAVGGTVLGSLAVSWLGERDEVPGDELELIEALAAQLALALDRVQRAAATRARQELAEARRERDEEALRSQARVLELIAGGAPVDLVLTALARWVEQTLEDTTCAVLLVDERAEGPVLRVAAAPSLPSSYRACLDGAPVSSPGSPCSLAAAQGAAVLVADLLADDRWTDLRATAVELGLASCWSFPVRSPATGATIGTVALHREAPGLPDPSTRALVERASHLVGITVDRHRLVTSLDHQARHDALTGLPNRFQLIERLELALDRLRHGRGPAPVVVFLDLDRLKVVNDSLGHEMGDVLLVDMAQRVRAAVHPLDLVARFGGDEFVVLCERADVDVEGLARQVLEVIAQPLVLEGRRITPGASAGVLVATHEQSATDVLRDADIAMYRAKSRGGGTHAVFGHQMRQRAFDRLDMEGQVRHGLSAHEFVLHYQPIVDLQGGDRLIGFEALVRWEHPERGLLWPSEFLPLAEETGLVVPLGSWVLRTATEAAARWAALSDGAGLLMSVNLTAQQLLVDGLVPLVRHCQAQLAPWRLALELTESALMDDTAAVTSVVAQLAATGAGLVIDDFGTGFSSLSYLTRLPIRRLKIDRSFVADLPHKAEAVKVVAAIISLAGELGLQVVAEGIETVEQRDSLVALGCRYGQGYLFGHPLQEQDALALLLDV